MAPMKRSADRDGSNSKNSKHSNDQRAAKRTKTDDGSSKPKKSKSKTSEPTENEVKARNKKDNAPVQKSLLKSEEKSFPRGGASVLTPLEYKQIQIEATQDVLFEQGGAKRPTNISDSEGNDDVTAVGVERKRMRQSKSGRAHKPGAAWTKEQPSAKIEGLSYKRLVPGSLVLGQVMQITSRDVTLALPNNLLGFVSISAVSAQLTERLERLLDADEEQGDDGKDEFEDIDLKKLFRIGQYLRAYVTSNATEEKKKRIELSLDPHLTNTGLAKSDIVVDSMLQASVVSIEDHGMVMNLGLEDSSIKGFMGAKDLDANWDKADIEEGAVFLCLVTGINSSGSIVKLSADQKKAGNTKKPHIVKSAPTINAFLPGTSAEILVTDVTSFGIKAQIMGSLNVTADLIHSGGGQGVTDIESRFSVGSKLKARIIFSFLKDDSNQIGVSVLEHVLSLSAQSLGNKAGVAPLDQLPLSSFVEAAKVLKVESNKGLFMDVGVPRVQAFAHISRLSDKKIDLLSQDSGPYKLGSVHRARVVGFNAMDGLFLVSLEQAVLDQAFLRIADIEIGQVVKGTVEKIIVNKRGVGGILVKLADGITGLVPEMHMADVHLQHPDRKFQEGLKVKARILSVNSEKRTIRLTLKKSLVNSEVEPWISYDNLSIGDEAPGTIVKITPAGAIVSFYGRVQAWLPVAEMSEAYIKDPSEHFRLGQAVNVHIRDLDRETMKMTVSCKDPSIFGSKQQKAYEKIEIGSLVKATITEISTEFVNVDLKSGVKGILRLMQLTDASDKKCASVLKGLRVGQKLKDLLVLEKQEKQHIIVLSNKPSLIKAAAIGQLISSYEQIKEGLQVSGFVRNTSSAGIFVQFAAGLVALLPVSCMSDDMKELSESSFGLKIGQSISAYVWSTTPSDQRIILSTRQEQVEARTVKKVESTNRPTVDNNLINPVDKVSSTIHDFVLGKQTVARISTVCKKPPTQMNIRLADNVQGRIHVSEIFNDWDAIPDPKCPLKQFKESTNIPVTIIGLHDTKTYRFLPFTQRSALHSVYDCSAKTVQGGTVEQLRIDRLKLGEERVGFITSYPPGMALVHISSSISGKIDLVDFDDDGLSIAEQYPIGSALRVRVKSLDLDNNRVAFVPSSMTDKPQTISIMDLKVGSVHSGRIVKVTERDLMVKLSDTIVGFVPLTELDDDYDKANPTTYDKNDMVRVRVADIDMPNKRLTFTMRPSVVNPSTVSAPVKDRYIAKYSDLKPSDVVRGFIRAVRDSGLVVDVGPQIKALIPVHETFDDYIKDWKEGFEIDQLITAKVIDSDPDSKRLRMSLKKSVMANTHWSPELKWEDLKVGQIVNATVVNVFDYGVFIIIKNSRHIRGLCHKSEMADGRVKDVSKLYDVGDKVKAMVIKVDLGSQKRVNFSLKASHFTKLASGEDEDEDAAEEEYAEGVVLNEEDAEMGEIGLGDVKDISVDDTDAESDSQSILDTKMLSSKSKPSSGLSTKGFDWTGMLDATADDGYASDVSQVIAKKRKNRKAKIEIDKTGDLDKNDPQSIADFERQLLGQPNASALWIRYMAFQLGLSEIDKARGIAERALRTIHMREEDEKLNIWIALLNLENAYGTEESLESVFGRACQTGDKKEMHQRLASIYIDSEKYKEAEDLFERMRKIKEASLDPSYWLNYATFLMTSLNRPDSARSLLQRATQALPPHEHRPVISRFASLEFTSPNGDAERGRTIFEGLVETYKNRDDLWDQYLDLECGANGDVEKARALFERMVAMHMKPRRAKYLFKRFLGFEKRVGTEKQVRNVELKAAEYVEKHGQRKD